MIYERRGIKMLVDRRGTIEFQSWNFPVANVHVRSRPYLSILQPQFGQVQPPQSVSFMSFGMRILGAITPHLGQGLRAKVTPHLLFLFVKIYSVIAPPRTTTNRPIKEKTSAFNEPVPYSTCASALALFTTSVLATGRTSTGKQSKSACSRPCRRLRCTRLRQLQLNFTIFRLPTQRPMFSGWLLEQ